MVARQDSSTQTYLVRSELLLGSLSVILASGLGGLLVLVGSVLFLLLSLLLTGLLSLLELGLGDHLSSDLVKVQLGNSGSSSVDSRIAGSGLLVRHGESICGRLAVLAESNWGGYLEQVEIYRNKKKCPLSHRLRVRAEIRVTPPCDQWRGWRQGYFFLKWTGIQFPDPADALHAINGAEHLAWGWLACIAQAEYLLGMVKLIHINEPFNGCVLKYLNKLYTIRFESTYNQVEM